MKLLTTLLAVIWLSNVFAQTLDLPLIEVNETVVAYAKVDEIHFTLKIKTTENLIKDARDENRKIAESVFAVLEKRNIPKRFIQTRRMSVSKNFLRNKISQNVYDGFNATQVIYVCLKDLNAYDDLIDELLEMDIENIDGPHFKSSEYEMVLKAAKIEALSKARETASNMASALGQKIGKAKLVSAIQNQSVNNTGYNNNRTASTNDAQGGRASFEVGEIKVQASVNVSFHLLD